MYKILVAEWRQKQHISDQLLFQKYAVIQTNPACLQNNEHIV